MCYILLYLQLEMILLYFNVIVFLYNLYFKYSKRHFEKEVHKFTERVVHGTKKSKNL